MKYMIDIPTEVADIIVPQLETALGIKLVKVVDEEPPAKPRRKTWRTRRAVKNPYPNKSYLLVGNYFHVFFDKPCVDAQNLKVNCLARWDGVHGYWYCINSEPNTRYLKDNGYINLDEDNQ